MARQAQAVIEAGRPRVEHFDLADDDLILGFGVGCDGQVRVLIEPVRPRQSTPDPRPQNASSRSNAPCSFDWAE